MVASALTPIPLEPVPRIALRRPEAAEALGVSDRTLWKWTQEERVPHVRIGSTIMYPVAALTAWLLNEANAELLKTENTPDKRDGP